MKAILLNLVLISLCANIGLTLISIYSHYKLSKSDMKEKTNSNFLIFSEDLINLKISALNALFLVGKTLLGFSIIMFSLYHTHGYWSELLMWNWTSLFLCLFCVDFLYFVSHFAGHKVQFFWNYHSVHHNSSQFSLSTGYRVSWVKYIFDWIFYLPIALVGFPPEMVLACITIITCYTHVLHTQKIDSIPIYEYIFNTPKAHRIHHSSYEHHIDKNMGGILLIWDHLFGTFSLANKNQVTYGLTTPLEKNNLLFINFSEWQKSLLIFSKYGKKMGLNFLLKNPMKNKNLI
jgi:alkylglycerol monooxygenase